MDTMDTRTLYDRDFHAWTVEQAAALRRAGAARSNAGVDWDNLAEEIEDMGRNVRDALENHLATVIEHLLKLEYAPDANPRRVWRLTVGKARRHLARKLAQNPSLQNYPGQVLEDVYRDGRDDALKDDSLAETPLPAACPYTLDQILSEDWWPASRHGLG